MLVAVCLGRWMPGPLGCCSWTCTEVQHRSSASPSVHNVRPIIAISCIYFAESTIAQHALWRIVICTLHRIRCLRAVRLHFVYIVNLQPVYSTTIQGQLKVP